MTDSSALLVYRDRIVPRSEAQFLRRQYIAFRHLAPVWIGCRKDVGLPDLRAEPILLGRSGPAGVLDRLLFKQFGRMPPAPDLAMLILAFVPLIVSRYDGLPIVAIRPAFRGRAWHSRPPKR